MSKHASTITAQQHDSELIREDVEIVWTGCPADIPHKHSEIIKGLASGQTWAMIQTSVPCSSQTVARVAKIYHVQIATLAANLDLLRAARMRAITDSVIGTGLLLAAQAHARVKSGDVSAKEYRDIVSAVESLDKLRHNLEHDKSTPRKQQRRMLADASAALSELESVSSGE